MMVNYPQEAWHVEKIKESVSEFGIFLVWNRDGSNRARILVKVRVPDLLEVPISLVLCQNTSDEGHGHSWTVVNYILQAKLIGGLGADEDPLPPDGETLIHCQIFPLVVSGMIWSMTTMQTMRCRIMLHQTKEMLHMMAMLLQLLLLMGSPWCIPLPKPLCITVKAVITRILSLLWRQLMLLQHITAC
jgi:hypothetical protein